MQASLGSDYGALGQAASWLYVVIQWDRNYLESFMLNLHLAVVVPLEQTIFQHDALPSVQCSKFFSQLCASIFVILEGTESVCDGSDSWELGCNNRNLWKRCVVLQAATCTIDLEATCLQFVCYCCCSVTWRIVAEQYFRAHKRCIILKSTIMLFRMLDTQHFSRVLTRTAVTCLSTLWLCSADGWTPWIMPLFSFMPLSSVYLALGKCKLTVIGFAAGDVLQQILIFYVLLYIFDSLTYSSP